MYSFYGASTIKKKREAWIIQGKWFLFPKFVIILSENLLNFSIDFRNASKNYSESCANEKRQYQYT